MKSSHILFIYGVIAFLSGCSLPGGGVAIIPTQVITNDGIEAISKKYQNAVCTKIETGCTQVGEPRVGSWLEHINTCQVTQTQTQIQLIRQCEVLRNAIIGELILIADHNYHAYEGGMIAGRAKNNFYTGALRTSLETAGALITVANTTRVLSGLAAFTGTIHESSDKEFFFDNTIDALIIQMRADRATALAQLLNGRKAGYGDYSIEMAIGDITNYYRAGTLASAIVSISKSASAAEAIANEEVKQAR
jgi:hypothetical protein